MSSIRPDIFLPGLVTKLETSLTSLTSPHKFTAAAKCLRSVARWDHLINTCEIQIILCRLLTKPGPLYPEGRGHIISILVSVLPGIDCNDIKKTMSEFHPRADKTGAVHFGRSHVYRGNFSVLILSGFHFLLILGEFHKFRNRVLPPQRCPYGG